MRKFVFFLLGLVLCEAGFAWSTGPKICMILDKAGKNDHSINQDAYSGLQEALQTLPIDKKSRVFEAQTDAQVEQAIRGFVKNRCALIFSVGINNTDAVKKLAPNYPKQKFIVIDSILHAKNVRSIVFREDQGAFLMGAIAALKSTTHQVGFIGGMDVPLIKRFEVAYRAGALFVDPKVQVLVSYVGVTVDAWNNPTKAKELALAQYSKNVDVIFQAAGGSGLGVFDAAETASQSGQKRFAIGCDTNQNWMKPHLILTSMIKGVKQSVVKSIQQLIKGEFTAGIEEDSLGNGGIDWALDKNNSDLFSKDEKDKIEQIKKDIVLGKIQVPDYLKGSK